MNRKRVGKKDRRSKSSWARELAYRDTKREVIVEWKSLNQWSCIFSGAKMGKSPSCHHLIGKNESLYYEKENLTFGREKYRRMYHNCTIEELMKQDWWEGFLERLELRCPKYSKNVLKQIEDRKEKSTFNKTKKQTK